MNDKTKLIWQTFLNENQFLHSIENQVISAFHNIKKIYDNGNKLLVCGNGGSCADSDHIVGELVKGFRLRRPLSDEQKQVLLQNGLDEKNIDLLQGSLPAISLTAHTSLMTAVINDLGQELMYAQQVIGYGRSGDGLIGISTSGNAVNVNNAAKVAKSQGLYTLLFTGENGGDGAKIFDDIIQVPSGNTSIIQDMHSVVYHALCAMIESEYWNN